MPGTDDGLGKKAEEKIKSWLDNPESGYSFDRFYDQMSGMYLVSRNICDFVVYKKPYQYYIESKSTWSDRFSFSMLSDTQYNGLLNKSKIQGVYGLVFVLFATYQRAFILDIRDIDAQLIEGKHKSVNIKKRDRWDIPSIEIQTIPSKKSLLDYTGDLEDYVGELIHSRVDSLQNT